MQRAGAVPQRDTLSALESVIALRETQADALRGEFRFREAISEYESLLSLVGDSPRGETIRRKLTESRRGVIMTDHCRQPEVVARRVFPVKDFVLYYPFKNGSWRPLPNSFDPLPEDGFVQALYAPKGAKELYYSAPDAAHCRDIWYSRDLDSLWSVPQLLGEALLSAGHEIYPMLSADGNTLYFASDGLYGMGGYDLYKSVRDTETGRWGEPENLGFPYNSPSDDFLMIGTEDGKYAIFASNRSCSRDSVCLYVLDAATLDRPAQVSGEEQLRALAQLIPTEDLKRIDNNSMVDRGVSSTDGTLAYREQMNVVRSLKDRIYRYEKAIDEMKLSATAATAAALADSVAMLEAVLPMLRDSLEKENAKVHRIESEFLRNGVVSSRDGRSSDLEVVGAASAYTFTKHTYGARIRVNLATEDPSAGTFSIRPVGRFATVALPRGTVYQIRFLTTDYHASLDEIKGLSPVYERLTGDLRYAYTVGLFPTYQAALAALNRVRVLGFPDSRIVLFRDGREEEIAKNLVNP